MTRHVAVVVNVEVANVQDLAEDAMQITVTAPRVPWRGAMKKRQDMDVDKKDAESQVRLLNYFKIITPYINLSVSVILTSYYHVDVCSSHQFSSQFGFN